jgi:hypothetical protein
MLSLDSLYQITSEHSARIVWAGMALITERVDKDKINVGFITHC